jgi:hypothetical protein
VGNAVEGSHSNFKAFLSTVPKGIDAYRQYAADRQHKLEETERLRKKFDEKMSKEK